MEIRTAVVALVALLPASRFKNSLLRGLGWKIGPGVRIGPCLVLRVDEATIADRSDIGPFNVLRNLTRFEIGPGARIGQWNFLTASHHMTASGGPGSFALGAEASLTSRHYVDCTGGVQIGAYSTVAGERSTFITHGISWVTSDQTYGEIVIGEFCLLSSNVQVAPGSVVGDRIIVGMGATIAGELSEPGLYIQPRAQLVKRDLKGEYFQRRLGSIDSVRPRQ